MIELGPATEAEMIAAFLSAEIHSSRWGKAILSVLPLYGGDRHVVDAPLVDDAKENAIRRSVLAHYRGYPDAMLFTGFPAGVTWHRVRLEPDDFLRVRYARHADLLALSGPGRLVTDGARNFSAGRAGAAGMAHIADVVDALKRGTTFSPLIAAEDRDGSLILIEGHSRATAYVIADATRGIEALVARATGAGSFRGWHFY